MASVKSNYGNFKANQLVLLALPVVLSYLWLSWDSLNSMVEIWLRSGNFAHGIVIVPISLWLIYRRHQFLKRIPLKPFWPTLVPTTLMVGVLLVGQATNTQVVEHFASVALVMLLVPLLAGIDFTKAILFPLCYLLFAVPFGEELTPWLQQVTADISVYALQLTGIPVFVNGLFIEIPSGNFKVAEACSGIRYLISSVAVGTIYAYITYNSLKKRVLFVLFAIAMPIFANGLRAYLIILIAHLSDMKYAVGVDHLIYGWVFFGAVILLMFWIGGFWADHDVEPTPEPSGQGPSRIKAVGIAALVATVLFSSGGALATLSKSSIQPTIYEKLAVSIPSLTPVPVRSDWKPDFVEPDREYRGSFLTDEGTEFDLYIAEYRNESQNKELINQQNIFYQRRNWVVKESNRQVVGSIEVNTLEMRRIDGHKRLIWFWYEVNQQAATTPLAVKLLQARVKLFGQPVIGRAYLLAIDFDENKAAAEKVLRTIITDFQVRLSQLP